MQLYSEVINEILRTSCHDDTSCENKAQVESSWNYPLMMPNVRNDRKMSGHVTLVPVVTHLVRWGDRTAKNICFNK